MVREAKVLVEKGKIGIVEDINFEYVQDWSEGKTISKKNSKKMFRWKLDQKIVGVSAVLNELGFSKEEIVELERTGATKPDK